MAKAKTVKTDEEREEDRMLTLTPEESLRAEFRAKLAAVRKEQMEGVGALALTAAIDAIHEKVGRYPKYVSIRVAVDPETGSFDPEAIGARIVVPARAKAVKEAA